MKAVFFGTAALSAGPAFAHVGHLAEVAGHSHWVGAAAAAAAVGIGLWIGLKAKSEEADDDDAEGAHEAEPREVRSVSSSGRIDFRCVSPAAGTRRTDTLSQRKLDVF